jgi:diguanylate cyclase (GGDEF)-like protein/PAS domain S-box-containing protein
MISAPKSQEEGVFKVNWAQWGLKSALHESQRKGGYLIEAQEDRRRSLIGYDYSSGYDDFPGLGWAALVIQDVSSVFAPIERLKVFVFGAGTVVALFVVAISLMVTRKMTNPILKISEIARRVAQGDFEGKTDYTSKDEIGSLTETFNQMIQDLKRQRAQLVDKHYVDSIIANMMNTLIVVSPDGIIKTVNQATIDVLGCTKDELVGQPVTIIFGEQLPFKWPGFEDLIEKGFISSMESTYLSKNRSKIPVFFSASVMRGLNGEIQGVIFVAQDITERKRAEAALAEQAIRDVLTNLYNRRYFNHRIGEEIARADRNKHCLAILLCDLDHFKAINDTRGHQEGDEVLKMVARAIQQSTRGTDLVFRWGGDEIVVVLSDTTREGILLTADRIRRSIRAIGEKTSLDVDLSIGVAFYPEHGRTVDELIRLADRALYIAKKGGDKIHIGEEEYHLDEHSIKIEFQPIMNIRTHKILGYEALSRDSKGKLKILELFRKYDNVGQLSEVKRLCFKLQLKSAQNLGLKRVFVNVDFNILNQLEVIPKPPGTEIILEISELEALHDVEDRLKITKQWREKGYKFAIDDFGAGFISLPFIAQLFPDYIKMDRSTIIQAVSSEKFRGLLKDLQSALRNYSTQGIIAEGIETEKELQVVKNIGIYLVQGFLLGRPRELGGFSGGGHLH